MLLSNLQSQHVVNILTVNKSDLLLIELKKTKAITPVF